jgi:hypothetical protein
MLIYRIKPLKPVVHQLAYRVDQLRSEVRRADKRE